MSFPLRPPAASHIRIEFIQVTARMGAAVCVVLRQSNYSFFHFWRSEADELGALAASERRELGWRFSLFSLIIIRLYPVDNARPEKDLKVAAEPVAGDLLVLPCEHIRIALDPGWFTKK